MPKTLGVQPLRSLPAILIARRHTCCKRIQCITHTAQCSPAKGLHLPLKHVRWEIPQRLHKS